MAEEFVTQAYSEISEMDADRIRGDEKVKAAMRSRSGRVGTLTYGEFILRFRCTLNKRLRKQIRLAKELSGNEEESEKILYQSLAMMCTEAPWNDWKTWAVYDSELPDGGIGALEIFSDIIKEIMRLNEDVKNFR